MAIPPTRAHWDIMFFGDTVPIRAPLALMLPYQDRLTSRGDLIATQEIKFPGRKLFQAQALDLEDP